MRSILWLLSLPFRLVGTLLVVAGFAAGFFDLYLSVQRGETVLTSLGETVALVSPDAFGLLPAAPAEAAADAPAAAADAVAAAAPVIEFFLNLPSFLALLILATLFLLVAQLIYRPR